MGEKFKNILITSNVVPNQLWFCMGCLNSKGIGDLNIIDGNLMVGVFKKILLSLINTKTVQNPFIFFQDSDLKQKSR